MRASSLVTCTAGTLVRYYRLCCLLSACMSLFLCCARVVDVAAPSIVAAAAASPAAVVFAAAVSVSARVGDTTGPASLRLRLDSPLRLCCLLSACISLSVCLSARLLCAVCVCNGVADVCTSTGTIHRDS